MAKIKEETARIFHYVMEQEDENITAKDIAEALGVEDVRKINGAITAAYCRHREEVNGEKVITPLMERVEGELEIENEDGTVKHVPAKFIKMTDFGRNFNIDAD